MTTGAVAGVDPDLGPPSRRVEGITDVAVTSAVAPIVGRSTRRCSSSSSRRAARISTSSCSRTCARRTTPRSSAARQRLRHELPAARPAERPDRARTARTRSPTRTHADRPGGVPARRPDGGEDRRQPARAAGGVADAHRPLGVARDGRGHGDAADRAAGLLPGVASRRLRRRTTSRTRSRRCSAGRSSPTTRSRRRSARRSTRTRSSPAARPTTCCSRATCARR
jgi:hypothetical protein